MIELLKITITGVVVMLFAGYITPKFLIWGTIGIAAIALSYAIMPGPDFVAADVINNMMPHIIDFLTIYPRAIGMAAASNGAEHGLIGSIVVFIWGIVLLPFYLFGLFMGLITWPELLIFRVFL